MITIIRVISTCSILLSFSASTIWTFSYTQVVPTEVTRVASDYLEFVKEKAREDASFWDRKWKYKPVCDQDSIKLGAPYREYIVTSDNVCDFAATGDLMASLSFRAFTFPVYDCSELMGAILVGDYEGEWRWLGRHYKYDTNVKRILELREQFKADDGYSVIYVRANKGFGVSIVVLINGQPHMIMPCSVWTQEELLGDDYDGEHQLLSAEEVLPVFIKYAHEQKKQLDKLKQLGN